MKKNLTLLLAVMIAVQLCACGCMDKNTTINDTTPTVTLPDPTSGTNIPDPTVNDNSTENGSLIDDITEMTGDIIG